MSATTRGRLAAVATCLLSALLGWLSGYNFDTRGSGVALWAGNTTVFAVIMYNLAAAK